MPGRNSTTRYSPRSLLVVVRTFSIRTGLETSMATSGRTPPELSVTTPEMLAALVPWAAAASGSNVATDHAMNIRDADARRRESRHASRRGGRVDVRWSISAVPNEENELCAAGGGDCDLRFAVDAPTALLSNAKAESAESSAGAA